MAEDVDTSVEGSLEELVSVTENSKKLRKDQKDMILRSVSNLRKVFIELQTSLATSNEEKCVLHKKVKEMEAMIQIEKELSSKATPSLGLFQQLSDSPRDCPTPSGVQRKKLYSETVRPHNFKEEKRFKLIVSTKSDESSDSVKTLLKSKIDPTSINVGIQTFKSLKDGRVLIETRSKEEIEILNDKINNCCGNTLEAKVSKLRNPNLIIYNIPNDINKENATDIIVAQNSELALKEDDIIPKFTFRNKKNNLNLIVEVTSEVRKKLLEHKIKLGWVICRAVDYVVPLKCFKCSRFNHKHMMCEGVQTCPLCTGNHRLKECTASPTDYKCINCIAYNKYSKGDNISVNHSSLAKNCPSLLVAIRKCKENTDY